MEIEHQARITSSEIASLWSAYQNNSMVICVLKYFLAIVNDQDVKSILDFALETSEYSLNKAMKILNENNQPIPVGFTADDVSSNAPRLYSDAFYLYYLKSMAKIGVSIFGVALATTAQEDVRDYLSQSIQTSTELYNKTAKLLLAKGLFIRTPYVATIKETDFVDKQNYIGGLFNLNRRPLNVIEITHVSANIETNVIGQTLLTGFAQVAKDQKVRKYCFRGKDIAKKHVQLFASILSQDDVVSPMQWDLEISDSTIAPFSDKLMMFHATLLIASGISNYATASAASLRLDLATTYTRLIAEVGEYAKEGTELMINNEWLEQPPQIVDRKDLANI